MQINFEEGEVICIDKDLEWTSFDVVKKIRGALKIKKIGHAGTLDPLATGLLVLCTGKKTKTINDFMNFDKEYTGKMIIGKTTPSYDLETEIDSDTDISNVTISRIRELLNEFKGEIMQVPPIYSALKVNGKRSYLLARKGEEVKFKARPVQVHEFEITAYDFPALTFRVVCSKGTYIRSLAHDFGQALGVGAYLAELRRTRIGNLSVDKAFQVQKYIDGIKASTL